MGTTPRIPPTPKSSPVKLIVVLGCVVEGPEPKEAAMPTIAITKTPLTNNIAMIRLSLLPVLAKNWKMHEVE